MDFGGGFGWGVSIFWFFFIKKERKVNKIQRSTVVKFSSIFGTRFENATQKIII